MMDTETKVLATDTKLAHFARKFLLSNPAYIATVASVHFFECPEYGEDAPLVAIVKNSKGLWCKKNTAFMEIPNFEDVADFLLSNTIAAEIQLELDL
tara:strand:- start:394 stop:684 length:291 start_codon:yes stop_codon:yes gene_type:complete